MAKEMTREEIDKAMFMNLVMMLGTSAIQQLGKLANPVTNKMEVDLEGAQATIDLIEVLERKTKGNLDKDEAMLMKQTLSGLQMNFVETAREEGGKAAPDAEAPASAEEKPAAGAPASNAAGEQPGKPKPEPKFHKSYE